jgi:aminopeptidase N
MVRRALVAVVALVLAGPACSSSAPHPATPTPPPDAAPAPPPPDAAPAPPPAPTLRLPTTFVPRSYAARIRVDPRQPRFDGEIRIDATLAAASPVVWLDAERLTIDHAEAIAAGATVPLTATQTGRQFLELSAPHALPAGPVTLHLTYHGTLDDASSAGAFRQEVDGDWYAYTQLEALWARRVFPCVDEPGTKVPWQLTLEAPAGLVALSNTGVERQDELAGGWIAYHFAKTHPLPSYLVAFAVGPFELVDAGRTRGGAPIRIAAIKGRAKEAAFAARMTPRLVAALEDWFGIPYPYDKLDLVPIPQTLTFGAMENAGMITFASPIIEIDPDDPSIEHKRRFSTTAAHELSHQWFGDLVTPAWWNDIWLNEAFATWMQEKAIAAVEPSWHAELQEVDRVDYALGADALASARMIRQPIADENDIASAFDGITYSKGASVIRMFERWVGPDRFRKGVHAYLTAHAYGTATAGDFLAAIGTAAGKDVATPFRTFLEQAGAPRLSAELRCAGGKATLALHQDRYLPRGSAAPAGAAPTWQLPVCAAYDAGGKRATACTLMTGADAELALPAPRCPGWAWPDADAAGYVRVALPAAALTALETHGWRQLTVPERVALAGDVDAMIARGDADLKAALDLVPRLVRDGNRAEVDRAAALAQLPAPYLDGAMRARHDAWIVKSFGPLARRLGWTRRRRDDSDTERLRAIVVPLVADAGDRGLRNQAVRLAARWRDLPASIRGEVLAVAAADPKTFARLRGDLFTEKDRLRRRELLAALVGVRDPALVPQALAAMLDKRLDAREIARIRPRVRATPATRAAAIAFFRDHLDQLFAETPPEGRARLADMLTQACDADQAGAIAKLVTDRFSGVEGGPRAVAQGIEAMDQCIARGALLGPAIERAFGDKQKGRSK